MSQTIQCPKCLTSYEVEEISYGAKFQCGNCGESFTAVEAKSSSDIFCSDRTIAPRNIHIAKPDESYNESITMPGQRDAKPAGRFGVGDLILRRYKVLAELGQGGMGVVYKCFDETAGIEVALKALPPELSHNTLEMEDVKENFQLVSRLVHQNIAIYRNLEKESVTGNYYLIMECVDGEDLRRWIKRKRKDGSLTIDSILPVIRQIADALDYAHEQKIIHRDIKPGNIMIDANEQIKVLDFGLAAQIHTSMTRVSMAYHGTSGTGPYMAPEQWRGRAQGAAADQYALAVMTYEMLAGNLPFESTDPAVLQQAVLTQTADKLPDSSASVNQALTRAMSKEPAERFANCTDFAEALGGKKFKSAQKTSVKKSLFICLAVLLVLIIAGGGYAYWQYQDSQGRIAEENRIAAEKAGKERIAKMEAAKKAEEERKAAEAKRLAEEKRKAESPYKMKSILISLLMYAYDNKEQFPDNLKLLSDGGYMEDNSYVDWEEKNCYYLGKGLGPGEGKFPVLFERPGINSDRVYVGFQSGAVFQYNITNYTSPRQILDVVSNELAEHEIQLLGKKLAEIEKMEGDAHYAEEICKVKDAGKILAKQKNDAEKKDDVLGKQIISQFFEEIQNINTLEDALNYIESDIKIKKNDLDILQIDMKSIQEAYKTAELNLKREQELIKAYATTQRNYEQAEFTYQKEKNTLEAMKEKILIAKNNISCMESRCAFIRMQLSKGIHGEQNLKQLFEKTNDQEKFEPILTFAEAMVKIKESDLVIQRTDLKSIQATYKTAELNLKREQELIKANATSQLDYEQAKLVYQKEKEKLSLMDNKIIIAEKNLSNAINQRDYILLKMKKIEFTGTVMLPGNVKLEMLKVEHGTFTMSQDAKAHEVTLTKDYYLGKTELTQGQWEAVMGTSISEQRDKADKSEPLAGTGADYPMYYVSWHEAMEYCRKLNEGGYAPKGWKFTLPTETQWEYACRGGKKSKGYTYSGGNSVADVAWYYENSGREKLDENNWKVENLDSNGCSTHPVSVKSPNELGFYDMSGNVWEWCLDDYKLDSREAVSEFTRNEDSSNADRVFRGGSWCFHAWNCRAAIRGDDSPGLRNFNVGFRPALVRVQ